MTLHNFSFFILQLTVQCTFTTTERGNLAKSAISRWTSSTICYIALHVANITIIQELMYGSLQLYVQDGNVKSANGVKFAGKLIKMIGTCFVTSAMGPFMLIV